MKKTSRRPSAAVDENDKLLIGVSSCLLGEHVRFDGGHKRYDYLTDTVSHFVRFLPICPEVDVGLGTPRETIRLEGKVDSPRVVAPKSGTDHTTAFEKYGRRKTAELRAADLSGYVFKKDSPSCGLFRVRVYGPSGMPVKTGRGLFAAAVTEAFPLLPVEEEGRLRDPRLRENFFERVFAYRRMRQLFQGRWKVGDLVRFHSSEKLLLLAHDRPAYTKLGRLVADPKKRSRSALAEDYQSTFMTALARIATTRKHTNVLQHVAGHFKKLLTSTEKEELHTAIDNFHQGLVPLVVPVTLLNYFVRVHDVEYLAQQTYLNPHPRELMLRNHT